MRPEETKHKKKRYLLGVSGYPLALGCTAAYEFMSNSFYDLYILLFVAVARQSCIFLDFEFYSYFPCIQEETGHFEINASFYQHSLNIVQSCDYQPVLAGPISP